LWKDNVKQWLFDLQSTEPYKIILIVKTGIKYNVTRIYQDNVKATLFVDKFQKRFDSSQ